MWVLWWHVELAVFGSRHVDEDTRREKSNLGRMLKIIRSKDLPWGDVVSVWVGTRLSVLMTRYLGMQQS